MIHGEDLIHIGFAEGKIIGDILKIVESNLQHISDEDVLGMLNKLVRYPESFLDDPILSGIAGMLIPQPKEATSSTLELRENGDPYNVFGEEHIEEGAIRQMNTAMKLKVTLGGALMPDAHQGYGLPIGGVLATHNAIIPYGVGVDIGCRMALSIYDIPDQHLLESIHSYKRELIAFTKFGAGNSWRGREKADHEVLERKEFHINTFVRNLHEKAAAQLGTSGGGNHFVEFGIMTFEKADETLQIPAGKYVALLTHSGSRGFGATIANHYTKLARQICPLPGEAAHLAYMDLNSQEGQEYWIAMNLAGDYASACHEIIHQRITKAIGAEILGKVENHHNFAWKEQWQGREVIVHRKGATPAAKDVMGIIPGSMTAPGFLVRGKGNEASIQSASHGAGRQMSRTKAIKTITHQEMKQILKDHGVTLIGAGLDEAPMAYKDIHVVMAAQQELVDVAAKFEPKLVRMADDGSRED